MTEQTGDAPRRHPNQTPIETEQQIVELRHEHMRWGPRKLKAVLARGQPDQTGSAGSTMGELLRRVGLRCGRMAKRFALFSVLARPTRALAFPNIGAVRPVNTPAVATRELVDKSVLVTSGRPSATNENLPVAIDASNFECALRLAHDVNVEAYR